MSNEVPPDFSQLKHSTVAMVPAELFDKDGKRLAEGQAIIDEGKVVIFYPDGAAPMQPLAENGRRLDPKSGSSIGVTAGRICGDGNPHLHFPKVDDSLPLPAKTALYQQEQTSISGIEIRRP